MKINGNKDNNDASQHLNVWCVCCLFLSFSPVFLFFFFARSAYEQTSVESGVEEKIQSRQFIDKLKTKITAVTMKKNPKIKAFPY